MFILKKGHQPGVYVPLRALFLVFIAILSLLLVKVWHLLVNAALKECSLGTD